MTGCPGLNLVARPLAGKGEQAMMMNGMSGGMMAGMSILWLLVIAVLVLVGAAAIKYLFFAKRD